MDPSIGAVGLVNRTRGCRYIRSSKASRDRVASCPAARTQFCPFFFFYKRSSIRHSTPPVIENSLFSDVATDLFSLKQAGVSLASCMIVNLWSQTFWYLGAPLQVNDISDSVPFNVTRSKRWYLSFCHPEPLCTWGGGWFWLRTEKNPSTPFLAVKM